MQNVHTYDYVLWLDWLYTGFNLGTEPKSDSESTKSKWWVHGELITPCQDRFWPQTGQKTEVYPANFVYLWQCFVGGFVMCRFLLRHWAWIRLRFDKIQVVNAWWPNNPGPSTPFSRVLLALALYGHGMVLKWTLTTIWHARVPKGCMRQVLR